MNDIQEKIERLRRLHGWSSNTEQVSAAVPSGGGRKDASPRMVLHYNLEGEAPAQFEVGENYCVIGSGDRADLRILKPSLSARHSRISRDDEGNYRVRDMNTQSGTWVNDERIPLSADLLDGDILRCGEVAFRISIGKPLAEGGEGKKDGRLDSGASSRDASQVVQADGKAGAASREEAEAWEDDSSMAPEWQQATGVVSGSGASLTRPPSARARGKDESVEAALSRPVPVHGRLGAGAVLAGQGERVRGRDSRPVPSARPEGRHEEDVLPRASAEEAPRPVPSHRGQGDLEEQGASPGWAAFPQSDAFLVYYEEDGHEAEAPIPPEGPFLVGRRSSSNLSLKTEGISGRHAVFEWLDGELLVRDLGSTNGTWVNDERVSRAVLQDQDVVRFGLCPVRVRVVPRPEPELSPDFIEEDDFEEAATLIATLDDLAPARAEMVEALAAKKKAPSPWYVLYVNDAGELAATQLDAERSCVVVGSGPVELQVAHDALFPEHIQLDWLDGELSVVQAHPEALFNLNGEAAIQAQLQDGDRLEIDGWELRLVEGTIQEDQRQEDQRQEDEGQSFPTEEARLWAERILARQSELEVLVIYPVPEGGRLEISFWGDGICQVEAYIGGEHGKYPARMDESVMAILERLLIQSRFPDELTYDAESAHAEPALHVFWGDEGVSVVVDRALSESRPMLARFCAVLHAVGRLMNV